MSLRHYTRNLFIFLFAFHPFVVYTTSVIVNVVSSLFSVGLNLILFGF